MHEIAKRYVEHIRAYEKSRQGPPSVASALYPHLERNDKRAVPASASAPMQGVSLASRLYPYLPRGKGNG
jgi:hypothetical protein